MEKHRACQSQDIGADDAHFPVIPLSCKGLERSVQEHDPAGRGSPVPSVTLER